MTETISAEIISAVLQMKRMTREQWRTSPYVPRQGEPVCESDTGFMKVGDGTHRFPDLKYLTGPQGPQGIQGVQGPPGRDGVVTFENLSQAQRNSLKGDRGEQGPPGPAGPRGADGARGATGERGTIGPAGPAGPTGERGHSLTANVRIEGNFRNGVNSQLSVIADVYFDGVKVTSGYTADFYYRGFGNDDWITLTNRQPDQNGKIAEWSRAQRRGEYLEVYIVVNYNNLKAAASTRLDNIRDGERGQTGSQGPAGAVGPAGPVGPTGATGQPGQNIINQRTGQPMKYWFGSKAEFDAISNKDAGTIYDYF